jgi:menaquinone-dependent protoporphyrinogen IX oxidase
MIMAQKTLVAFASKGGATKETSEIIADVLKNKFRFEVDFVDLRKSSKNIMVYSNIIIGAGVRGKKVYREALDFLNQDFGQRKLAFFVCCGGAGDPKNYEESCEKYVNEVLAKYPNVKTVATEAFGGRMKVLGRTLFDNVDKEKIHAWAEILGNKFRI